MYVRAGRERDGDWRQALGHGGRWGNREQVGFYFKANREPPKGLKEERERDLVFCREYSGSVSEQRQRDQIKHFLKAQPFWFCKTEPKPWPFGWKKEVG